jgi:O-antigen ligase
MFNPAGPYFYLLVYLAVLYLRPHEYLPAMQGVPVVPVLLWLAFGMWLLTQPKRFEAPHFVLLPGLSLAMALSVAMSGWGTGAVNAFVDFAPTVMLFFLVATSVDSLQRLREMAFTLTAVVAVIALHGIAQAANEDGIGWTGVVVINGRSTYLGLLNDPNDLSMVFLMTLPLTLYLARVTESTLLRLALWAAGAAILYAGYLCNSRGAMLGLAAMLLTYGIRRYGLLGSLLASPLLLAPLVLLAPSRMNDMSADEASAAGRVDAWYAGFEMLRSHPLFGIGKGLFTDHHGLTAHNSFVLAFAEMGLFGYFFWLSMLVMSALMLRALLQPALADPVPTAAPAAPATPPTANATQPPAYAAQPPLRAELAADEAAANVPPWPDLQLAAATLLYSLVGTLVTAFFLSRTYVVFLFLLLALIVAVHAMARQHWPARVQALQFGEHVGPIVGLELASIVGLWVMTRLTLTL